MTDLDADLARGREAAHLVQNEVLKQAFGQMRADYIKAWENTAARDTDARERLWQAVQVVGIVQRQLVSWMNDGKIAQADIDRLANGPKPNLSVA